jgi:hypothetical protein
MHGRNWFRLVILFTLLVGCNYPRTQIVEPTESSSMDEIGTAVAQTAAVRLAEFTTSAPPATQPIIVQLTLEPTLTATNLPTYTPIPTLTTTPTATPTQIPCNRASFVEDITYPDNTEVPVGSDFTKTWRLKNNGSCTWTSGYSLIFDHGDRMNAPDSIQLTSGTVPPGGRLDLSVNLKAPGTPGTYQAFFKLRAPDNNVFGINTDGQGAFWTKIVVPAAVVALPDLRITGMEFSMNPPKKGVAFTITVKVKNKGNAPAGAFAVQWWASWAVTACNWAVPSLNINEEKTLTCNYTYGGWSTYTVRAVADPANSVVESNEGNNVREATYQVQP